MLEEDEKAFGGNGGNATQMDDIFDELSKLSQVILDNFGSVPSIPTSVQDRPKNLSFYIILG